MRYIVVYKFGSRSFEKESLSAKEGIKQYILHADGNGDKTLLTINKFPAVMHRDNVDKVILTTKRGDYAIIADVKDLGRFPSVPPEGYTKPSIWNNEDEKALGWFALENLKLITIKAGEYTTVTGKDLLESISGNGYMTYVEIA